ncbi:MAG: hypothetical protein ACK5OC_25795 [Pirellula sp.]
MLTYNTRPIGEYFSSRMAHVHFALGGTPFKSIFGFGENDAPKVVRQIDHGPLRLFGYVDM